MSLEVCFCLRFVWLLSNKCSVGATWWPQWATSLNCTCGYQTGALDPSEGHWMMWGCTTAAWKFDQIKLTRFLVKTNSKSSKNCFQFEWRDRIHSPEVRTRLNSWAVSVYGIELKLCHFGRYPLTHAAEASHFLIHVSTTQGPQIESPHWKSLRELILDRQYEHEEWSQQEKPV